ncbi:MAG TPA: hypothetical protein VF461_14090 [Gemmatimonadaceae bacterium]
MHGDALGARHTDLIHAAVRLSRDSKGARDASAAIVLGRRALIDVPTWLIFAIAMGIFVWSKRKIPEPLVIVAAGIAGVAIQASSR